MSAAAVFTPTTIAIAPRYDPTGVVRLRKDGAQLLHDWVMGSPRIFFLVCVEPIATTAAVAVTRCNVTRDTSDMMDPAMLASLDALAQRIVRYAMG